jgi:SAM-dependent methyltransferase
MERALVRTLAFTLFASAFLLFWCEPMVGKMALPYLGGAAAVWTTCLLFFQAMLLAGYVYAHLLGRIAQVRTQIAIHFVVLLVALPFLPFTMTDTIGRSAFAHPTQTLLAQLLLKVGVPFFVLSSTAPLLQSWLSRSGNEAARDPYFLYAASNAGSLIALLIYPFWVEPGIGVAAQSKFWAGGYAVMIVMMIASAVVIWKAPIVIADHSHAEDDSPEPPPAPRTRALWLFPAFVASGLMIAVTSHITSDLTSAPFIWILPLAIYLFTFIAAFSQRLRFGSARVSRLIPLILLAVFPFVCTDVIAPPGLNWILIAAHLTLLYAGALLCHARLAESRPDSRYLTEFYFWVALGGVLGGVFTATLAPILFSTVLEYPILVAALAFLRVSSVGSPKATAADWAYPAAVAAGIALVWLIFRQTGIDQDVTAPALIHTSLVYAAYKFRTRPFRFALMLTVYVIAYVMVLPYYIEGADRIYVARDFFGVKKVLRNGTFRTLRHGDTTHGSENTLYPGEPTSYYHPTGTVGQVMNAMDKPFEHVGVVGLGTGSMAGYSRPGRHFTFFDIDPQVEYIARTYFTFLAKCGSACTVVIGDGRLELQRFPENSFDLLMLDAFSSDAIPAHLLSREAVDVYLSKLSPGGVLLFHVSNRYLDVEKLVEALAFNAGLVAFRRIDEAGGLAAEGKASTNHVIVARRIEDLGSIPQLPGWQQINQAPGIRVWTDDYSSLLELVRWH